MNRVPICLAIVFLAGCGGSSSGTKTSSYAGAYKGFYEDQVGTVSQVTLNVDASGVITGSSTEATASGTLDATGAVVITLTPTGGTAETFTGPLDKPSAGKYISLVLTGETSAKHVLNAGLLFNETTPTTKGNPFAGNYSGTHGTHGMGFVVDANGNVSGFAIQFSSSTPEIAVLSGSINISGAISWTAIGSATAQAYTGTLSLSGGNLTGTLTTNGANEPAAFASI